jgi:hypothetical protein
MILQVACLLVLGWMMTMAFLEWFPPRGSKKR